MFQFITKIEDYDSRYVYLQTTWACVHLCKFEKSVSSGSIEVSTLKNIKQTPVELKRNQSQVMVKYKSYTKVLIGVGEVVLDIKIT